MKYEEYLPDKTDSLELTKYYDFINTVIERNSKLDSDGFKGFHTHHIIPKMFLNTIEEIEDTDNIIPITKEEHIEAHRLLASAINLPRMKISYYLLNYKNLPEEERKELSKAYREAGKQPIHHTPYFYLKKKRKEEEKAKLKARIVPEFTIKQLPAYIPESLHEAYLNSLSNKDWITYLFTHPSHP